MAIQLTRESLSFEESNPLGVWFLRVRAVSTEPGLSSKIFVYHSVKEYLPGELNKDVFSCIASPAQMGELPEDEGIFEEGNIVPFYRTDVLEVFLRTPQEVEEVWGIVIEDVQSLLAGWRVRENLTQTVTVTID
jgi:hypothetical protein